MSFYSRITGSTNEDAIFLGSATDIASNTLELSDAELDRVTADVLRIGSNRANDITVISEIDPAGTDTLHLITRGSVWQSGQSAIVRETNLAVEAGGVIALNRAPNEVDVFAMSTTMGTLSFRERGGFEVGVVDGVAGINGPGVSIYCESGTAGDGSITIASVSNGIHGNWMDITSGGALTIEAGANLDAATGNIMLQADKLRLMGDVSAPADKQVWILPRNAGRAIDLGSTTDAAIGVLELSDAELDRITAGTVRIGSNGTGAMTVSAVLTPAGTDTLHLVSGVSISQTAVLIVPYLAAEASGSVLLENAYNQFDTVAGASTNGSVKFRDGDGFFVGSVDSIEGVQAHDYASLVASTGNVTLRNTSQDYDVLAPAGIAVTAWEDEACFEAESGASMQSATSVNVMADRMKLAGTIESRSVTLFTPPQLHQVVDLGSTTDSAPNTLELSNAELSGITATTELQIGRWSDSVIVTQPVVVAGANRLWLRSVGTISQTAPIMQAWLMAEATGSVNLDGSNDVDRIAIKSTSGDIIFNDVDGFLGDRYDGTPAFNAVNGSVTLSAESGNVALSMPSQSDVLSAAGPVTITLNGPETLLELTSNATMRSFGTVSITAVKMKLLGPIAAPGQIVSLQSATAGNAVDLGSTTDVAPNALELSNTELNNITADVLRIGSLAAGSIVVSAPIAMTGVPTLRLTTQGDVVYGAAGSLAVDQLAVVVQGSVLLEGNETRLSAVAVEQSEPDVGVTERIHIENTGFLTVGTVDGIHGITAYSEDIVITTHSPLTIDAPIVNHQGGSITLIASNDGGDDDHLTINAPVQTSGGDGDITLTAGTNLVINDTGGENAVSVAGTGAIQATAEQATELAATTVLSAESGSVSLATNDLVIHGSAEIDVVTDPATGAATLVLNGIEIGTVEIAPDGEITSVQEGAEAINPPELSVDDVTGLEGTQIPLPISAALSVADGSQTLSVKISGAPVGATLSNGGTLMDEPAGASGVWWLEAEDLAGLTIRIPDSSTYSLTVIATATGVSGVSASNICGIVAQVANVAPVVTAVGDAVIVNLGETAFNTGIVTDPGNDVVTVSASAGTITRDGEVWMWSYDSTDSVPGTQTVTITATDVDGASGSTEFELTVRNLTEISGRVFDDRDNDGVFDPDNDRDAPLNDITMELVDESTGGVAATTATVDGEYVFFDIQPGTYTIRQATQPSGFLDGLESTGALGGGTTDNADSNAITGILVGQLGDPLVADGYDFAELTPVQLRGLVWEDFNTNGEVDLGERAISGVTITLSGTDDRGNAVTVSQVTNEQGIFEFVNLGADPDSDVFLRPGVYTLTETQPNGFIDGVETLGVVEMPPPKVVLGSAGVADADTVDPATGDVIASSFSGIFLTPGADGMNYNFGERIDGGQLGTGQTATIGFWQNKHGQALIQSLNGSPEATLLASWLSSTFPNMYGQLGDADDDGVADDPLTNLQLADLYRQLFKRSGKDSPGGPPKLDAQVLAVALATYVTKESLVEIAFDTSATDPDLIVAVQSYGFQVTVGGVGSAWLNVGDFGAAFGVDDNTEVQIIDLLLATDRMSTGGLLYDFDHDGDASDDGGDGVIDDWEQLLRTLANDAYSAINEQGGR